MEHIVIIGNGIAGTTAAREIRKRSNVKITIISSESTHFFSRTALMYVYMGHMTFKDITPYEPDFWKTNRIDLVHDKVTQLNESERTISTEKTGKISYSKLILATGSKPNFIGWKGQDLEGVQGLYSKQDLELLYANTQNCKTAVIVGGGLIGIELTEMLLSRGIHVHFLIREKHFWKSVLPKQDAELLMKHFEKHHHLTMHYGAELEEINGNDANKVVSIKTKTGEIIPTDFVGLTIGVVANVDFLKNTHLKINRGIVVNQFLETNLENVYAIGDCAEIEQPVTGRRSVEQVWYTARIMGETVADNVCGKQHAYDPGFWFNSAKFFDIEYQTYGTVLSQLTENQSEFVWKHATKELLLHFVFETDSHKFIGINTFGIRMRHELFDAWLKQGKTIDFVLENLKTANFDPEFFKGFEEEIINQFNGHFDKQLTVSKKIWWRKLLATN